MREALFLSFLGVIFAQNECPDHAEVQCWDGIVPSCMDYNATEYNATDFVSTDDYFDDDCLNVCVCNEGKEMQVWGKPELNQFVCTDDCSQPVVFMVKFTLRFIVLSSTSFDVIDVELELLISIAGKTIHIIPGEILEVTERAGKQLQVFRLVCFDDLSEDEADEVKKQLVEKFESQDEMASVHLEDTESFDNAVMSFEPALLEVPGPSDCMVNETMWEYNGLYEAMGL